VTAAQVLIMCVGTGNLVGMMLNIYGKPYGWLIVFVTQLVFSSYIIVTQQWYGFPQFGCTIASGYGFVRWLRRGVHHTGTAERSPTQPVAPAAPTR
jgi:hypothetical protein